MCVFSVCYLVQILYFWDQLQIIYNGPRNHEQKHVKKIGPEIRIAVSMVRFEVTVLVLLLAGCAAAFSPQPALAPALRHNNGHVCMAKGRKRAAVKKFFTETLLRRKPDQVPIYFSRSSCGCCLALMWCAARFKKLSWMTFRSRRRPRWRRSI